MHRGLFASVLTFNLWFCKLRPEVGEVKDDCCSNPAPRPAPGRTRGGQRGSASVRTSGIGLTLGAGPVGSVVGPYAAGVLLSMGLSIGSTCLILGVPAIAAAAILLLDRSKSRASELTFPSVDDVTATNVSDPAFAKLPARAP